MTSKEQRIAAILSGSATPACDLLSMVENGELTAHEATAALRSTSRCSDVHSAAAAEIDHMRRCDA